MILKFVGRRKKVTEPTVDYKPRRLRICLSREEMHAATCGTLTGLDNPGLKHSEPVGVDRANDVGLSKSDPTD